MTKREFLTAGIGTGLALAKSSVGFAQQASPAKRQVSTRLAKTTKLFKSPRGFPNAIAVTPEGLWIGEQKLSGSQAAAYHLDEPKILTEEAWLVDWNGKTAEDGDDSFEKHQRNGSGRRVCLDGRECAAGRSVSGRYELAACQSPSDSARSRE